MAEKAGRYQFQPNEETAARVRMQLNLDFLINRKNR